MPRSVPRRRLPGIFRPFDSERIEDCRDPQPILLLLVTAVDLAIWPEISRHPPNQTQLVGKLGRGFVYNAFD
jgi:hypothetical protein